MQRLFSDRLYADEVAVDEQGRIRVDDWEMEQDIQDAVAAAWGNVSTETINELTDFAGYQEEFLKLFGFGLEGVDYEADTDPQTAPPSLAAE